MISFNNILFQKKKIKFMSNKMNQIREKYKIYNNKFNKKNK